MRIGICLNEVLRDTLSQMAYTYKKYIDENFDDNVLERDIESELHKTFVFKDKDEFVPVNYLGDGFKRIFYIILKVLSLKGERIMIDEIETGIHHSRQKDFWSNILKICNELNVQLFATTHSKECIKVFYEASKELNEQKDIRLISLQEGEQEKIYSTTYTFENIEAGLYSDIELRA
jgi:AAA15 family ATPase/GTPase